VERLQAYKFELMPNGQQQNDMSRFAGSCRFVFNKALALQKELYESNSSDSADKSGADGSLEHEPVSEPDFGSELANNPAKHKPKKLSYGGLCKELTTWKTESELAWLKESPSQVLQQSLKDLEKAYANFFAKRASFPRFKKRGRGSCSFRYPDPKQFKVDQQNSRIFLPKLGWIRYRNSRVVLGEPKNVTISQRGGKWFFSLQTKREVEKPTPPSGEPVGIDLGIARFATLSNGTYFEPLNSFKKLQAKLARAQRSLSRKVKFSSNWKKIKKRIGKIHIAIANARADYLHKTSTTMSKNHAIVCIEDLQVKNMSASAVGTVDNPGKCVSAKAGLNRSILDQGWYEFRRQLEYKTSWNGGSVVAVPPQNTSRTCPLCGHVAKDNRTSQASFACMACGHTDNADVVGAINVLNKGMSLVEKIHPPRAGHARLACGEVNVSFSVKQEPTESVLRECSSACV
jgi:putative transposase